MGDKKILIICGPTATGKTALGLSLAKKYNGNLVSADSRQVYKGLDILTGKDMPTEWTMHNGQRIIRFRDKPYVLQAPIVQDIPIWMYNVVGVDEEFSVAHYQHLARNIIVYLWDKGILPIVVGGTGLYIKSLLDTLLTLEIPRDIHLREQLNNMSVSQLQEKLTTEDTYRYQEMNASDRANPRRLIRAIETSTWIKVNKGQLASQGETLRGCDVMRIGLTASKAELEARISNRVKAQWEQGAIKDVDTLISKQNKNKPLTSALGIQSIERFLKGDLTKQQAMDEWIQSDVQYAKRQMTWFRKEKEIYWFSCIDNEHQSHIDALVDAWYTRHISV